MGWSVLALLLTGTCASPAFPAEDLMLHSGTDLYVRYCASCHGLRGEGDGPVAPFFKLQPPDLTRIAQRRGGKFPREELRKIIDGRTLLAAHGTRNMPVWGLEFAAALDGNSPSEAEAGTLVSRLLDYLRSIQRN
jgi:mono/diheme cytochrome c family protein